jgi:hypothetical protein
MTKSIQQPLPSLQRARASQDKGAKAAAKVRPPRSHAYIS